MSATTRPALRYLGGKWKLAPWIIGLMPPHRVYVEPFGGAASVLLRKPRSPGECYNDLNGELVNLFRVLRNRRASAELRRQIALTPFARAEYDAAFGEASSPIERARRLVVRSYMGHGSSAATSEKSTGFRASMVNRGGALPAGDWTTLPLALDQIVERIQGVLLEQRPALQVIDRYDQPDTLFYVDPPYLPETRSAKRKGGKASHVYAFELTADEHVVLLDRLAGAQGMVMLSGYAHPTYDDTLSGWSRYEIETHADGALDRVEVLWVNPAAEAAKGDLLARMSGAAA
jgi:DNA adenine methylase